MKKQDLVKLMKEMIAELEMVGDTCKVNQYTKILDILEEEE